MAENYSVNDFLMENVGRSTETIEVHFKRFKAPFKIKSLTAEESSELRKQATKRVLNKRTHQYSQETDQNLFGDLVLAKSVVFPDLENAELQKSWGVIGSPEKLIKAMLTMGEYNELSEKIMEVSGLNNEDSEDLVEEAKN
ncbi:phage tail assembly chaperone [Lactobacillus sp. PSON]|uniref:phage tail assembly chaperone n=1 Tax=Lactobacillus sp. PSON TaxID=3455454 RepID=UPI00404130B4